jgi:hypothetical protein
MKKVQEIFKNNCQNRKIKAKDYDINNRNEKRFKFSFQNEIFNVYFCQATKTRGLAPLNSRLE